MTADVTHTTWAISEELLAILVCPVSGGPLVFDSETSVLISEKAGLAFPVVDGILHLDESEATPI